MISNQTGQLAVNAKPSRIHSDTEQLRSMINRVGNITARVTGHARALGYFAETPEAAGSVNKLSPISHTLRDSLSDMDRALDELSGALNVFD